VHFARRRNAPPVWVASAARKTAAEAYRLSTVDSPSCATSAERAVVLRTGIVLDRNTPALDRLAGLARWGLGGRIGNGRQWVGWIHIADWLVIVRVALDGPLSGVLVAMSPQPVRNAELMAELRSAGRRPVAPPTPAIVVKIGSVLLRADPALALTGRRATPRRLLDAGFTMSYPRITEALADLLT
jgi:uncharacterized protein